MLTKQYLCGFILVITACLSLPYLSFSQNILSPDQPEQDACNALPLCGGKFFTPYSYQGIGLVSDLTGTPCGAGEDNSMWLKVTIANPGQIVFKIIPLNPTDDYDFAVLDVTNVDCSHLSTLDVVRCNFNNNWPGSNVMGIVGLSDTGKMTTVAAGVTGWSFLAPIDATAGQTYLIMINNFGPDADPGPSHGFTIDFSGSTATFQGNAPPAFQSIVKHCSDSNVTVQLNGPIQCSSITADGSQFYITPTIPITGASGMNCVNISGYTSQVVISFSGYAAPGSYVLHGQTGTIGTTLVNLCGDAMNVTSDSSTIPFTVPSQVQDNYLSPDTTKCNYSTITEGALRAFDSYLWSTGQSTPTIPILDPGLYTLQVTDSNGCIGTDSVTITDSTCPQYVYLPNAFTPNGDGKNDIFRPVFAGAASTFRFAVYDRWGRAVFVTSTPGAGWDGTTGGRPQPAGAYVWECVYQLYQEPERMQRGTVMLIR
jgi:gliding motility-associated-like protein